MISRLFRSGAAACAVALTSLASMSAAADVDVPASPIHLRIVGGLAGVNQFTRHEEPFWTNQVPRLTNGRVTAEVVAYDRAGIRGNEMIRLVQLGTVPFGTALLTQIAAEDPEVFAPDLAGMNVDLAHVRRNAAAFRPFLEKLLRERYGNELLALYVYPAQEAFCSRPVVSLSDFANRRIRVSNPSQSDFLMALGAVPVQIPFAEINAHIRNGSIDCAVTGTMTGNTTELDTLTSHLYSMPLGWGMAAFVANQAAWAALPADLQSLLRREMPRLEKAIWDESELQTEEGIACNIGASSCRNGRKGHMLQIRPSPADDLRRNEILIKSVLPSWIRRCGPKCADVWAKTLAPVTGIALR